MLVLFFLHFCAEQRRPLGLQLFLRFPKFFKGLIPEGQPEFNSLARANWKFQGRLTSEQQRPCAESSALAEKRTAIAR